MKPQYFPLPREIILSKQVKRAIHEGNPVVALESTVITHGLPYPENLSLAREMEAIVTGENVTPATIAVIQGMIHVGLDSPQLERLVELQDPWKINTAMVLGYPKFKQEGIVPREFRPITWFREGTSGPEVEE